MAPPPEPRAVRTLNRVSCPTAAPSDDVAPPASTSKKEEARGTGKRRWTDKLRCKIVNAVRPSPRRTAPTTKVEPHCDDVDAETKRLQQAINQHQPRRTRTVTEVEQHQHCNVNVEKQRLQQEIAELQERRRRSQRSGRPKDVEGDGNGAAEAAINLDARPKKGTQNKVRPAVAATEESEIPTLVELLFPVGVLDKPLTSSTSSCPEKVVPESPTSVVAAADADAEKSQGAGSSTPVDRDLVDQRSEAKEVGERQARRRRALRWDEQALENDRRANDGYGPAEAVNLDARPKKGILKVRPAVVATEENKENPTLVELLFPTGFLSKPPQSFRSSGPEKGPAFLMSVIADAEKKQGARSRRTRIIDRDLVDQWSEAKENSLRRSRYLRDYCPFQRDDGEIVEEERPMKTGLPLDSPDAVAEFVKASVSRHLHKDDFINRHSFKRSCERFAREDSLPRRDCSAGG